MSHTIEDAIENLAGQVPRLVNPRIDQADKNLFKSLTRQFSNGLALTDRQLELCIKKIEKYRSGLERNAVDVDYLLANKPLRHPLREIDRSKFIKIDKSVDSSKYRIFLKTDNSKKNQEIWQSVRPELVGEVKETVSLKEIALNEQNILTLVDYFSSEGFDISEEILKLHKKMEFMLENPKNFAPYVDIENGRAVLKNTNRHCVSYFDKKFSSDAEFTLFDQILEAKKCGILQKSNEVTQAINDADINDQAKTILKSTETRFRLNPESTTPDQLVKILKDLNQWPILIILEEDSHVFDRLKSFYNALSTVLTNDEMTVFFRLSNGEQGTKEFNQFVKDNHLNNYIDSKIKAVFIGKNKISKPLYNADWSAEAAILVSAHDYGKLSAYLNDIPSVYYYNNSELMRNNKIKGARKIVQL